MGDAILHPVRTQSARRMVHLQTSAFTFQLRFAVQAFPILNSLTQKLTIVFKSLSRLSSEKLEYFHRARRHKYARLRR